MHVNNLYNRLVKEKDRLGRVAVRSPRTAQEIIDRKKYERVMNILWKRYEYGMSDALDEYRRQDQVDEISQVKRF